MTRSWQVIRIPVPKNTSYISQLEHVIAQFIHYQAWISVDLVTSVPQFMVGTHHYYSRFRFSLSRFEKTQAHQLVGSTLALSFVHPFVLSKVNESVGESVRRFVCGIVVWLVCMFD